MYEHRVCLPAFSMWDGIREHSTSVSANVNSLTRVDESTGSREQSHVLVALAIDSSPRRKQFAVCTHLAAPPAHGLQHSTAIVLASCASWCYQRCVRVFRGEMRILLSYYSFGCWHTQV